VVTALLALGGCKKITQAQCDELLDHYAELAVKERSPDAGPEASSAERARERREAENADELKNCTTEVQAKEHACAMKAETTAAVLKCLE
jgi:hypothetical protein